jgi:2-iminobutanoate/2-iminopropanoate deaminase
LPRDAFFPDDIARPRLPYSPVVRDGDRIYTAGQVAFDPSGVIVPGGIAEQTAQVLRNLEACLRAAGASLGDVLKVNVFLADLADFDAFNDVYREMFDEPYPARTTVQAGLPQGILIEVEAVAAAS